MSSAERLVFAAKQSALMRVLKWRLSPPRRRVPHSRVLSGESEFPVLSGDRRGETPDVSGAGGVMVFRELVFLIQTIGSFLSENFHRAIASSDTAIRFSNCIRNGSYFP